jgi:hypothetical protein
MDIDVITLIGYSFEWSLISADGALRLRTVDTHPNANRARARVRRIPFKQQERLLIRRDGNTG